MKNLLSLLMLLALIVSCSSDHDNDYDDNNTVTIDTQLIKKIELIDITNGDEKPFGETTFKYDNEDRLVKVKSTENDYVSGEITSIKETVLTYEYNNIKFSTMNEVDFKVWMNKGTFELDNQGKVYKVDVTEGDKNTMYYTFKYDGSKLLFTQMRTTGYVSKTSMEWSLDNIARFEWVLEQADTKNRDHQFESIEYNSYINNASLDLVRLICYGNEGNVGVRQMCGAEEGKYLNIVGRRVLNMPSRMIALADGSKVVKDFEYKRDRNNRIYEIKVKKVSTFRDEQTEIREYKYLIGY